ncbi:MAG: biotin/lipoyl-binding protein, partial [Hyphomicrobiales bacterium]|nr:biotin/lipoyl-binding protein [Hyphomicrobiales bacterium]
MTVVRTQMCLLAAGFALTAMATVVPAAGQGGDRPAPVVVEPVSVQPMTQTLPVIGRIITLQASVIASDVAGGVAKVDAEVGDRVETGDVVVTLTLDRLEAAVALAKAELEQARSRVESVEAAATSLREDYKRLESLQESPAFSQVQFDQVG